MHIILTTFLPDPVTTADLLYNQPTSPREGDTAVCEIPTNQPTYGCR